MDVIWCTKHAAPSELPGVNGLLERLRGALKPNTVSLHADLLLQGDDHLGALRAAAGVLPHARHDAVAKLGGLVGLVGDDTVNGGAQALLEGFPGVFSGAPVSSHAQQFL